MAALTCGVCGHTLTPTDLMCPGCMARVSHRPAASPAPAPLPDDDDGTNASDDGSTPDDAPHPTRRCPGADCGMPVDNEATACPYCLRELDTVTAPTDDHGASPDATPPSEASAALLPGPLADRFEVVEALPASGAEADLFVVDDHAGRRSMLKLYRRGIELSTGVIDTLTAADIAHVVRIEDHGRVDGRGYELLEYLAAGDLVRFQQRHGPRVDEPIVRLVLTELTDAIEHLHELGLKHGDLKPGNVLVRAEEPELDLVLTDFGLAAITDATIVFDGEARRTKRYSAPEQISGAQGRPPDIWALGVITMQLLLGRHPLEDIAEQTIDYHLLYQPWPIPYDAIDDRRWQQLFRGMLHRQPEHRWTIGMVKRWLRDLPVDDVPDPAAPAEQPRSFRFLGADHHTPSEVARVLAANWEQGTSRIGNVRTWAADSLEDPALVAWLDQLADSRHDRHGRLLRTVLRLDPELPPIYRGYDVGPDGLPPLAAAAVTGGPGSHEAELISSVLDQDVLGAVGELTGSPLHRAVAQALGPAQKRLDELLRTAANEGHETDVGTDDLARLRLVQVLVDDDERQRIATEVRAHHHDDLPRWYRELLRVDAGPAELVAAQAFLEPVLEAFAAERDARRRRELEQRAAASTGEARLARASRLAAALLIGALAAFLPVATVVALAAVAAIDRYGAAITRWLARESAVEMTLRRMLSLPWLTLRWLFAGTARVAGELVVLTILFAVAGVVVVAITAVLGSSAPDVVGQPAQLRDRVLLPAIVAAAAFMLLRPVPDDTSFPLLRRLGAHLRLAPLGVLALITAAGIGAVAATWQLGDPDPHSDIVVLAGPVTDHISDWAQRTFDTPAQTAPPPEPDPPPDTEPAADTEPQRWQVSGAFELNVRTEPGLDSQVLTTLRDGEARPATGRTRQIDDILWVELVLPGGTTGWASSRYLDAMP